MPDSAKTPDTPELALAQARCRELEEQLRRAQDDLEAAARAKSEFLANMSHEIRTPLNAILGMNQLALRSGLNPQQLDYVRKVQRSAQALLRTIDGILDFSKVEAGTLAIAKVPFRLRDVMDELVDVVGLDADEKGLELLWAESGDLLGVADQLIGDPMRLRQVLVNLCHNAIRFTGRGDVVVAVEAMARGDQAIRLRFSVRDTGVGMTREQQERYFHPFERADAAISRHYGGTGLGLAIAHRLVQLMGGAVDVESTPGQGTVFRFELAFDLHGPATLPAGLLALARARVLVVDDNASACRVEAEMASALGLVVESVRNGGDAQRIAVLAADAGRPFDLALIDWQMPEMDGVECARRLSVSLRDGAPRIVLMTAGGRDEVLQRLAANRVVVHDVIRKPIAWHTLLAACAGALGRTDDACEDLPRGEADDRHDRHDRLAGTRLLLAEDNVINQELVVKLLRGTGIDVVVADDGAEAVELVERERFDGVLMDCQMPGMDGYEAARRIRAMPQWKTLPIIAMTASTMDGDHEQALAAGMNDHIVKPLDVQTMFDAIARWIRPESPADAAPAAAPAAPLALDALPGIAAGIGRANTGGNDELYRRLLAMFRTGQAQFATQFIAARDRGDPEAALQLARNLCSVCASLGVVDVQQAAQALADACIRQADAVTTDRLLDDVERKLRQVIGGLQSLE